MRRLDRAADKTFGRHLEPDEKVVAVTEATWRGTGRFIGIGVLVGALCGSLYAVIVSTASPLPVIVLGSFAGVIGGYLTAKWKTRGTHGPGAPQVLVVLTDMRLLLFRNHAALRVQPLRSFALTDVSEVRSAPTFVGRYQRTDITFADRDPIRLLTTGPTDLAKAYREQSDGNRVD